jgi:hypothetical protein
MYRQYISQNSNLYIDHGSTSNLEHACEILGGLGPLVWEEIENVQTVHKPKLKFIYRLLNQREKYHMGP